MRRNRQRTQDTKPKKRHKISDHFSRKDFYCKSGLNEHGFRISAGLIGALELLRSKTTERINIEKGYECLESAEKKGKVKRNFHVQGLAANITIDNTPLEQVFLLAEEIPEFMGIGLDLDEGYVHVRVNKGTERELWVVKDDEEIIIDDSNRAKFNLIPAKNTDKRDTSN